MKKHLVSILICVNILLLILTSCVDNKYDTSSKDSARLPDESSKVEHWETEGSYPWEDDSNIPELRPPADPPPFINEGEDGEGENGDTWTIPEWGIPSMPFTEEDFNIPDFPVDLEESTPDFPFRLEQSTPELPLPK